MRTVLGIVGLALAIAAAAIVGSTATRSSAASHGTTGCQTSIKYCDPGKLPMGVYTTRYFLHGMRVEVPGRGWTSQQDSTTEFKLSPPGYPDPSSAPVIRFWIDPRVTTPCTDKVLPYKMTTPTRAVRWFATNSNFVVSATKRTTIAGHVPALRIDEVASSSAPHCPGAPERGADYFAFFGGPQPDVTDLAPTYTPGIKDGFGTGISEPVRLYFAAIGSRSHSHLFVIGVDTPNHNDLAGLRGDAAKMLAYLHLPKKLPGTGKRCNCLNASDSGPR